VVLTIYVTGCAKHQPAPPTPAGPAEAQNVFALLPDADGKDTGIVVSNTGGTQEIGKANQAVRVERTDVAPTAPFPIDQSTVRRLFGAALDVIPEPQIRFVLYFDEASDTINTQSQAIIPDILRAIGARRSTDISVTGHTDRTGASAGNYELGLRRAERVAAVLRGQGVDATSVFVTSHGESDPLVKTDPGVAEQRNRRVEVIVH